MTDKKVNEDLADLAGAAERDHEVQMARAELYKIAKYAIKLHDMLKGVSEAEGLEGWVQSKITKSADMIGSVYHHLDYETKFGDGEVAEGKYKNDAQRKAIHANKNKKNEGASTLDAIGAAIHKVVKGDKQKKPAVVTAPAKKPASKSKMKPLMPAQHEGTVNSVAKSAPSADKKAKTYPDAPASQKASIGKNAGKTGVKAQGGVKEDAYKSKLASKLAERTSADREVVEKAKSKAQQKFMGMVYAAKKGEKPASPEVAKVAKGMSKADAKDFAQTKHKGKPEHVKKK